MDVMYVVVQDNRRASTSDRGRATCLSPELAALIADAAVEHCTSGAPPAARPTSRALVCVAGEDTAHRHTRGEHELHAPAAEGLNHRPPSRWALSSQHAGAAPMQGMHGLEGGGGYYGSAWAPWSTATGSTLGALPLAHHMAGPPRVMPEIPRIKFPETKAGRRIQRRCGAQGSHAVAAV